MAGNFDLNQYVEVNERIIKFYEKYPEGSIQTEITHLEGDKVIVKAYAYRDREDTRPGTGHAMEKEGSSFINKTSHIENCETSAVGRALALLGFEVKKSVASREEVANARLNQNAQNGHSEKKNGNKTNGISEAEKTAIKALCKRKGVAEKTVMDYYQVDDFGNMSKTVYTKAVTYLNKKPDKAVS